MRRKRLIVGLFAAALVVGAVPVASAATGHDSGASTQVSAQGCHQLWAYRIKTGSTFRVHDRPTVQNQTHREVVLFRSQPLGHSTSAWAGGKSFMRSTKDGSLFYVGTLWDYKRDQLDYIRCV